MRILLIHPLDRADHGPWTEQSWGLIVDLGRDGTGTHEEWRTRFRCSVESLHELREGFEDFYKIRDLLAKGCHDAVDEYGLDWWEIFSILMHEELEVLLLLQRLARRIRSADEVHISRPSIYADILQCFLEAHVTVYRPQSGSGRLKHYLQALNRLTGSQILDVVGDKYDPGYQFRGRWKRKRASLTSPTVLIPTAYINVSRTGMAYAGTFPEQNFFLVTTRRSGWVPNPRPNVETAWLSAYASVRERSVKDTQVEQRFLALLVELCRFPEIKLLHLLKRFESFSSRLRHGLEVRDAWRNVLDTEPVKGVLCADDSNPYTRIPLLLARERGLASIACHHGALDARYLFKHSYGGVIWAKGKMEEDYLVRRCRVPAERVEICAPVSPGIPSTGENLGENRPYVLFISEAYEVSGGRAEGFYREILPPLVAMAQSAGKQVVAKLHPAESKKERVHILNRLLSAEQEKAVKVVSGPLTEDLLAKTWCAVTILSTVATECAMRGIPCFLCQWLELYPYEYVEQYLRFGVGIGLSGPADIANIPEYASQMAKTRTAIEDVYHPAEPGKLEELLNSIGRKCARLGARN